MDYKELKAKAALDAEADAKKRRELYAYARSKKFTGVQSRRLSATSKEVIDRMALERDGKRKLKG